jgi:hypothetical protein
MSPSSIGNVGERNDALALALASAGVFLLAVTVNSVVDGNGLPLFPLIGGVALIAYGFEKGDWEARLSRWWRSTRGKGDA